LTAPEERGIKPLRTNKPAEKPNKHFKTIHRKYIHPDILKKIIEYYLESGTWCLFEGETNIYSLNFANAVVPPPLLEPFPVKNANDFFDIYRDAKITKLTMGGAASAEEKEILGDVLDFYTINGYHEGIIKGESKSKGMLIILEELGIPRENCIAIGDSENDLEMIRCAGTGIAMGNASDELKAAASLITGNVENCGVAQALRIVL
jgi:HAD superfamily hydrolase (TIGR01484 family)